MSINATAKSRIRCFIQAGGRSSRMGADKAWLDIGGRPMIERVLDAAEKISPGLAIIIHAENPQSGKYRLLAEGRGADLIFDLHDHRGPLGGIDTALKNCLAGEAALILACDLPFMTAEFLALIARVHLSEGNDLTIPVDQNGRLQALAAIYSTSCLPQIEKMLAEEILKVARLCPLVRSRRVEFSEFSHLPNAGRLLTNVNSPEDYSAISV